MKNWGWLILVAIGLWAWSRSKVTPPAGVAAPPAGPTLQTVYAQFPSASPTAASKISRIMKLNALIQEKRELYLQEKITLEQFNTFLYPAEAEIRIYLQDIEVVTLIGYTQVP